MARKSASRTSASRKSTSTRSGSKSSSSKSASSKSSGSKGSGSTRSTRRSAAGDGSNRRSGPGSGPAWKSRLKDLQKRIATWDVDALLVTNARDVRYLTGFIGDDSWALVRQRSQQVHILTDFRFLEQVTQEAPQAKAIIRKKSLTEELLKLRDRYDLGKLALQNSHVTLAQRQAIAKKLGAKTLKPVDDGLLTQRAVKDASELTKLRKAITIAQDAFVETLKHIKPGITEVALAGRLEYEMRLRGAEGPSFPPIVAVDANSSLPHAVPSTKKVKKGSLIQFDWGALYQGYCSDLSRVVAVGKMNRQLKALYPIVLEAQHRGIEALRAGASQKQVDEAARSVIRRAGFGPKFGHSLGHGVGLNIHEQPTLSPRSEGTVEAGHVVTVEPGIYLPGVGGIRIEDDVHVTQRGPAVLSDLPRDLSDAII